MFRFLIILLFLAVQLLSAERELPNILNFAQTNNVSDMVRQNDTIFVATKGGLAQFQYSSGNFVSLFHSNEQFPDISLSALASDDGGLWVGSESGYLYERQKNGRQKIYDDLFAVKSRINKIKPHGNYLIIAHEKGLSIFDKKKGEVISTKRNFAGLANTSASIIEINADTLFAAVKSSSGVSGIVRLNGFTKLLGDVRLNDYSPLAAQIPWTVEPLEKEIRTIYFDNGKITASDMLVVFGNGYKIEGSIRDTSGNCFGIRKYNSAGEEIANYVFASSVSFMKFINGKIAVGTTFDFAFLFKEDINHNNSEQFVIPGLKINSNVSKLFADNDNSLWVLPSMNGQGVPSFCRNIISQIGTDGEINNYSPSDNCFGSTRCDGADVFTGIVQSGSKIFFGFGGDPLREYDKNTNSWGRWIFDNTNFTNSAELIKNNDNYGIWIKIDNIVEIDGLLYGTYWRNVDRNNGMELPVMFELNTTDKTFRHILFSAEEKLVEMPNGLIKTKEGMLLSFNKSKEMWLLGKEDYNIIANRVTIDNDPVKFETTGGQNTIISTFAEPIILDGTSDKDISLLPERFIGMKDIVLEYSEEVWNDTATQIRNVFWGTTADAIVERLVIDEYISLENGRLDSAVYDTTQINFTLSSLNGGINIESFALAITRGTKNFLWVGGDKGITRVQLPERISYSESEKKDYIFPNPFVLSRHTVLTIPAPQNSFVDIYSISGKLVKHIDENSAERTKTIDGSYMYKWRIPQKFATGTYIVAVKSFDGEKVARKNTKQYKLVVIK